MYIGEISVSNLIHFLAVGKVHAAELASQAVVPDIACELDGSARALLALRARGGLGVVRTLAGAFVQHISVRLLRVRTMPVFTRYMHKWISKYKYNYI